MSGTYATIEKKDRGPNNYLAYKTYSKHHGRQTLQHYKRELQALQQLGISSEKESKEYHIIQFIDTVESVDKYQLVFPFYRYTLASMMEYKPKKESSLARLFLSQVSKGLAYIHEHGIIHCDLSPSNILFDEVTENMFICDFGCADLSYTSDSLEPMEAVGTRYYKAPEHLLGLKRYTPATDVWSFGAIFVQLLLAYPVFAGESDIEQMGRIVFRLGKPSAQVLEEEMSSFPDTHKLLFFSDDSEDEYEYYTSSEEEEEDEDTNSFFGLNRQDSSYRRRLTDLLSEADISVKDQEIALKTLTWSIKHRLTVSEILSLSCMD